MHGTFQHCCLHKLPEHYPVGFRCDAMGCNSITSRNMPVCEYEMKSVSPDHPDKLNCSGIRNLGHILMASRCKRTLSSLHRCNAAQSPNTPLSLQGGWDIGNDRFYEILGLHKVDIPIDSVIKKAYHKAALAWHPDRNRKQPLLFVCPTEGGDSSFRCGCSSRTSEERGGSAIQRNPTRVRGAQRPRPSPRIRQVDATGIVRFILYKLFGRSQLISTSSPEWKTAASPW